MLHKRHRIFRRTTQVAFLIFSVISDAARPYAEWRPDETGGAVNRYFENYKIV
jgi:hypothetical protein